MGSAEPWLSDRELAAAGTLLGISAHVDSCRSPDRAQRALDYFSMSPERLELDSSGFAAPFGCVIAVRQGDRGGFTPVPAGLLVDSLGEIGDLLAEIARQRDDQVEQRWQRKMERGVPYLLAGSRHPVVAIEAPDNTGPPQLAIMYSDQQVVVLDVVSGLQPEILQRRLVESVASFDRIARDGDWSTDGTMAQVGHDATPLFLRIIAHPSKDLHYPGQASLHLRGFMWLVHTAARNPEDLWFFLRDLDNLKGSTELFAVDLCDVWEAWRNNDKSFVRGGKRLEGLFIEPGCGGKGEWIASAKDAPVERALLALELPQASAWPVLDHASHDRVYALDYNMDFVYQVLCWDVPAAVAMTDGGDPHTERGTVWGIATGIVWKLKGMKSAFEQAVTASGRQGLQIELVRAEGQTDRPISIIWQKGPLVLLAWSEDLLLIHREDSLAGEALTGRALSEAFDCPHTRQAFVAAWDASPPGVRADEVPFPANLVEQLSPERSHPSELARVGRRLGEHMAASDVECGTYEGEQAKRLESEVVYPWAIAELHRVIAPYSAQELLSMAFTQLERANCDLLVSRQRLAWQRGFPVQVDPDTKDDPPWVLHSERVELIKAIELIVEEMLSLPPSGNMAPDSLAWNEALSVAQLAFASCMRSETIHLGLTNAAVIVTDTFEVHFHQTDEPTDVDMSAYHRRYGEATLPDPIPINEPTAGRADEHRPMWQRSPAMANIDTALRAEMGFGFDALTGVLLAAWAWNVDHSGPYASATLEDITCRTTEYVPVPEVSPEEIRNAIRWQTLTVEGLQAEDREYWETGRRTARVAARPFVRDGDALVILPWTSGMLLRVVLNYLEEGLLPWPRSILPDGVNDALDGYRQTKNRQLERDCSDLVANSDHLVSIRNIQPHKAERLYGLRSLSGEVDLICVDSGESRIWVIEAKDPSRPFSPHQIRQTIERFHKANGYVDKLLRKVKDISRDASDLARSLDLPQPDREWDIQGLMVTRKVSPAAFQVRNRVPFCTIAELEEIVVHRGR